MSDSYFEENYLIVPPGQLSSEALQGVIEEFITREGTDYGEYEFSLADKVAHVRTQLKSALVQIVFDMRTETCTLMTREEVRQLAVKSN